MIPSTLPCFSYEAFARTSQVPALILGSHMVVTLRCAAVRSHLVTLARRRLREGWGQMAHTPPAVGGAVGVFFDESGDGADACRGCGGVRRPSGWPSGP